LRNRADLEIFATAILGEKSAGFERGAKRAWRAPSAQDSSAIGHRLSGRHGFGSLSFLIHPFAVVEIEPGAHDPVDGPQIDADQHEYSNDNETQDKAENVAEEREPECSNLPAKMAFQPRAFDVVPLYIN
jgi:hypothetical protein